MSGATDLEALKRAFGVAELHALAAAEGLIHRGSGRNRAECPGCRNGDPRGVSLGESDGIGVWKCQRDEQHRGTAIDFLMLSRSLSIADAVHELQRVAGTQPVRSSPRAAPAPSRPPLAEVRAVWAACMPVKCDGEISAAWSARGLDLVHVEDRDLARALPRGAMLPDWARCAGEAWSSSSHRLIVPMFDARGQLRSLHARAIAGRTKGLSPAGHAVGGLVMADPLARLLLAGARCGDGEPAVETVRRCGLVVCEGVPDFLTWATRWGDAADSAPAVIGIISGSWLAEIAADIPDGASVCLRAHADDTGAKYMRAVARTLESRCSVRLVVAEGGER